MLAAKSSDCEIETFARIGLFQSVKKLAVLHSHHNVDLGILVHRTEQLVGFLLVFRSQIVDTDGASEMSGAGDFTVSSEIGRSSKFLNSTNCPDSN